MEFTENDTHACPSTALSRTTAYGEAAGDPTRTVLGYDASHLLWSRDQELIIGRVLREGGWTQSRLLRDRYGDDAIRDWLERHECRGLSPARIRFWELILRLPLRRAAAWVRAARRSPWHGRTAALQNAGLTLVVDRTERGTLHGTVHGVRVSLIEYRYPLLDVAD